MSAVVAAPNAGMMTGLQPSSHNDTQDHNINRLTLNLSSNNPFRARAESPALPSPRAAISPVSLAPPPSSAQNRMSKNPFLDDAEVGTAVTNPNTINVPADIFNDLSLLDTPANGPKPKQHGPPPPYVAQPGRVPGPNPNGAPGPSRGPPRPPGSPRKMDGAHPRRPRGMSETSVTEKERRDRRERDRESSDRPPRTESEERRRQERRKAREERHRREKEAAGKDGKKPRRLQGLDIIDKLDVTGVYGQGLFHHDGPFDACNPHRNAKRDRKAPMQAFPANSANMQLGGSGPINNRLDLDRFHGRGEEAFDAFNSARQRRGETMIIDPTSRVEAIHGDETYGLGTSTFLEGAPASRKDLQRLDNNQQDDIVQGGGLSRKKSLAQKFRGMSSGRSARPTGLQSPDMKYNGDVFDGSSPNPQPMTAGQTMSAGGMSRTAYTRDNESNPFDKDYENDYEKKGAQIRVAEQERAAAHSRTLSSPQGRGLVRTVTADSAGDIARPPSNEGESSKSGFLSRMKSLKGGKRARPERRES